MNRDDIIRMAKQAHLFNDGGVWFSSALGSDVLHDDLERFANLVAAAEREACARIVDGEMWNCSMLMDNPPKSSAAWNIAVAIRARGE